MSWIIKNKCKWRQMYRKWTYLLWRSTSISADFFTVRGISVCMKISIFVSIVVSRMLSYSVVVSGVVIVVVEQWSNNTLPQKGISFSFFVINRSIEYSSTKWGVFLPPHVKCRLSSHFSLRDMSTHAEITDYTHHVSSVLLFYFRW